MAPLAHTNVFRIKDCEFSFLLSFCESASFCSAFSVKEEIQTDFDLDLDLAS